MFVMYRAVNGTRTRDIRLGKPTLYQLSYYRVRLADFLRLIVPCVRKEPITRLELVTHALRMRCSTN